MKNGGIYIHIPFCQRKCGYCDFYSVTSLNQRDLFVKALLKEIELVAPRYSHMFCNTIYFGGGIPTLLSTASLSEIMEHLFKYFSISSEGEFSIEANPGTLKKENLKELKKIGFNRLSLGVQSFFQEDLDFLGRIHTVEEAILSFNLARDTGFSNINIDLMTAFPGLTLEKFDQTLKRAMSLRPEHLSCYTLIFEPGTTFYNLMKTGKMSPLNDHQESEFYNMAEQILLDVGYSQYEISNFALEKKFRCQHNLKYWDHSPYLGLGPSAHSFISPKRRWNVRPLSNYLRILKDDILPIEQQETLDPNTLEFEYIYLHLRLKEGISLKEYKNRFRHSFVKKHQQVILKLKQDGFLSTTNDRVFLTKKGWLLADEIVQAF
jgi:oxygen-independent coproporphyrinogen-3 oxidase